MKIISLPALGMALICVSSCAQRITIQEYNEKCKEAYQMQNSATGCVYYCGSKNGYDYVYFSRFLGMDDLARIESGKLQLVEMKYTSNEADWIVIYPKFNKKQFGYDESYQFAPYELKLFPNGIPEKKSPYR